MALIFGLAIAFGRNKATADKAIKHFKGRRFKFTNGLESILETQCLEDREGNSWLLVCPNNLSKSGISSEEDAKQMSEIGEFLYKLLRTAPSFRYALVGVEVELFRLESEISGLDDVDFNGN